MDALPHNLLETAKKIRRMTPHVHPICVIQGEKQTVFADLEGMWGEHEDRCNAMYKIGTYLGYAVNAKHLYVVVDAWVGEQQAEGASVEEMERRLGAGEVPRPSNDPNRTEALLIVDQEKGGKQLLTMCRYTDKNGRIVFQEPKLIDDHVDYTFKYFWEGLAAGDELLVKATKQYGVAIDHVFPDSGLSVTDHFRRAAMTVAKEMLNADIWSSSNIMRQAENWRNN